MADFESILDKINSVNDTEINLFNRELEVILKKVALLVTVRAVESIKDPLTFDYSMQEILKDSGYYELIDEFIDTSYDKNYANIIALFESSGLTATFTQQDIDTLLNIKLLDLEFFQDIGAKAAKSLKADLYKYAISDTNKATIIQNISQSLEDTELVKYSKTYAETAISNYNQSVIDTKSKDVEGEVYIYRGVTDKKTREFCRCLTSSKKYYNRADASKIKNDKRRQYNCRHLIVPVSKDFGDMEGYTDGRFTC